VKEDNDMAKVKETAAQAVGRAKAAISRAKRKGEALASKVTDKVTGRARKRRKRAKVVAAVVGAAAAATAAGIIARKRKR
jgi:hypothetical protein